ncbi:MAG: hypothetical protein LUG13_04455 [Oscillospiraceae bacterium]|nr:hypothetical protein [Oscillospiraceae bacterium]
MYSNLKSAMDREQVTIDSLADTLNLHRNTVQNKLSGTSSWTYEEALMVKASYFQQYDLLWLFKKIKQAS